ncbi:hypothetical protein AB0280_17705 [Pseudarthrobacter sp902506025]|uniref:hypothetical protein n=1 Tax=Pseudarthrobacter sp. 902506025 TaxID=3155291 RepID=UPI00344EA041
MTEQTTLDDELGLGIRTGELTRMLVNKYPSNEQSVLLTQVRNGTGWAKQPSTADALLMGCWPSTGNDLTGFEIKVSRSDWLHEVKDPKKSSFIKQYCDFWYLLVADASMVKEGELPDDWGMMAVRNGSIEVIKPAPRLADPAPIDRIFLAAIFRKTLLEGVPPDVCNDLVLDAKREAVAVEKSKTKALKDYLKFLHKEIGIKIEYDKDYKEEWKAFVGRRSHAPEDIALAVRRVANGDHRDASQALDRMKTKASEIIKFIDGESDYVY